MNNLKQILSVALLGCSALVANAQEIKVAGQTIMSPSDFGITTSKRSWNAAACTVTSTKPRKITEKYNMITGKRSACKNTGTEQVFIMQNAEGARLALTIRQYKDGYAFRYSLQNMSSDEKVVAEQTKFHVPAAANRWMQQYSGPGFENMYPLCPGGVSPEGEKVTKWGYPALVELADNRFMFISDSYNFAKNCGNILTNTPEDRNTYSVQLFSEDEATNGVWQSAWHVIIAGTLADVVESTLVTDVADPCAFSDVSWIEPGVSSWIYWAYNHGSQEYSILKEYVDLAVDMKWPYTLVDAEWDVMRGGNIEELVKYAVSKNVKPIIWYNSTTNWVGEWAPTPQGRLNNPDDCDKEFAKIHDWGVRGVKIDFFRDDTRETAQYYYRLLKSAEKNHMLVNFHGGTIPHGWQRTYPNVITCEGVFGAEWYNNNGRLTNKAACHNATLPFTRNVIGPMDYTPGTFTDSQHPHITTNAHELALPILFESGIQHMPDRPDTYRNLPAQVKELLSGLPTAWDDTKLLAGYPGKYVVLARRKGNSWYVAGINGTDEAMNITFNCKSLKTKAKTALVIEDADNVAVGEKFAFKVAEEPFLSKEVINFSCKARGGFVMKL